MSDISPQTPIEPLSLGNVVSAGIRLYRSNLKSYFLLALMVSLWSLLAILFFVGSGIFLAFNFRFIQLNLNNPLNSPLSYLIFIVGGIVLYLYFLGKCSVNSATISRLAFAELIEQPETVNIARSQVAPKLWKFIKTIFLLFLIFFGAFIAFLIVMVLPIINLLAFFPAIAALLWLFTRFFIADTLLAIEDNLGATSAISRSWDLTKGNAWRIVLILVVSLLVTLPAQLIIQLLTRGTIETFVLPVITKSVNGSSSINEVLFAATVYILTLMLALLVNAIILPFWQAIKGVIYYDLRSRREGLGLKLRDR